MQFFPTKKIPYQAFTGYFFLFQQVFADTPWGYILFLFFLNPNLLFPLVNQSNSFYFLVKNFSNVKGFFHLLKDLSDSNVYYLTNFIFSEFLLQKKTYLFRTLSVDCFTTYANSKAFLYNNFQLKVDSISLVFFRRYLEYFRRFKYNEYLNEIFADNLTSIPRSKQYIYYSYKFDAIKHLRVDFRKYLFFNKYRVYKFFFNNVPYKSFLEMDSMGECSFSYFIVCSLHYESLFISFKLFFWNLLRHYYAFKLYKIILKCNSFYKLQRFSVATISDFMLPFFFYEFGRMPYLLAFYFYHFKAIIYFQVKRNSDFISEVSSKILGDGSKLIKFSESRFLYNVLYFFVLTYLDHQFYILLKTVDWLIPKSTVSFYRSVLESKLMGFTYILNSSSVYDVLFNIKYFKRMVDYWLWTIYNYPHHKNFVYLLENIKSLVAKIDSFTFFKSWYVSEADLVDRFLTSDTMKNKNLFFMVKTQYFNSIVRDLYCKLLLQTPRFHFLFSYKSILKIFLLFRYFFIKSTLLNQKNYLSFVELQIFWAQKKWTFYGPYYWYMASWDDLSHRKLKLLTLNKLT